MTWVWNFRTMCWKDVAAVFFCFFFCCQQNNLIVCFSTLFPLHSTTKVNHMWYFQANLWSLPQWNTHQFHSIILTFHWCFPDAEENADLHKGQKEEKEFGKCGLISYLVVGSYVPWRKAGGGGIFYPDISAPWRNTAIKIETMSGLYKNSLIWWASVNI